MPIAVTVTIDTSGFDAKNRRINAVFTSRRTANELANYLRLYHMRFRMKWRGSRYMSGPNSNMFWQEVVAGWQNPEISNNRIVLKNTFGLLAWKVTGGTIYPKTAKKLTIPLIPEAKGVRARDFSAEDGPLFAVGNALMRRLGKKLQAVYALVDSVVQQPWPGAMPSNEEIAAVYKQSVTTQIHEIR